MAASLISMCRSRSVTVLLSGSMILLAEETRASRSTCNSTVDLQSPYALGQALFGAVSSASKILQTADPFEGRPIAAMNAARAMAGILAKNEKHVDFAIRGLPEEQKESAALTRSVLRDLKDSFEWADAAYLDSPALKAKLVAGGFRLIRHQDGTAPGQVAFFVALNPHTKELVVGLKGTGSPSDILTDLVCNAVPLELFSGHTAHVHEGMSAAAVKVANELEGLLDTLAYPQGYRVTVLGHSLGAGSASILGLLLRDRARQWYKHRVRVLAYASPPVMDWQTSVLCQPFVTTVVSNFDVIPRSSLTNIVHLQLFLAELDEFLTSTKLDPTSLDLPFDDLMRFWQATDTKATALHDTLSKDFLFLPGKCIQFYDKDEEDSESKIGALFTDGRMSPVRMIHFSERILSDHLADSYRTILTKAANSDLWTKKRWFSPLLREPILSETECLAPLVNDDS